MADLTTTPVATQIQPPKNMTLADMVNLAGGIQAYQQSQQLNPLQLQKAQLELQQAQQTSPLAVREAAARTSTAETGSKKANSELNAYYQDQTRKTYGGLLTDPDFNPKNPNPEAIKEKLNEAKDYLVNVIGVPEHESKMHDKLLEHIDKHGAAGAQRVIQTIANGVQQAGTNTEQFGQVNKAPTYINQGQYAVPVYTSPYQSGGPGQAPAVKMQLPPEARKSITQADPVSGDTIVYDVDENGKPTNVRFLKQTAPNAAPPVAVSPGGNTETDKQRAANAINSYVGSVNALTDASKPGHIPTQEFVAKKLLTYLKDPQVETGPIADVLAGKTNQASLSSKEQEVLKLIQQRIQNLNPRTDADAQSKKDAYGSFRLKKDALADLVRQDLGNIQNQKLMATGMMNAAGDPKNPNLPAVNAFQNQFSNFSKNPALMQYIGIVGTGQTASIDDHDKNALKKLMKDNGLQNLSDLEQKRKQLVELSGVK